VVIGRFATGANASTAGSEAPLFRGEQILVRHDENYIEKNRDRLSGAVDDPSL
jgi:cytochrome c-type biogenesis protein CcmE